MTDFKSISIRYKILLVVGIALLGFVANMGFNYTVTTSNSVRMEQVRNVFFPILENIDANRVRLDKIKETLVAAVNGQEVDMVEEETDPLAKAMKDAFSSIAKLSPGVSDEVKTQVAAFETYYRSARSVTVGMIEGTLPPADMKRAMDKMISDVEAFSKGLEDFRSVSYQRFVGTLDAANESANFALYSSFIISFIAVAVVALIGFLVSRMVVRNILAVVNSLSDMANGEGDLTRRLEAQSNDEIGLLVKQFNRFVEKLQTIITNVAGSTTKLAAAAEEMSTISGQSNNSVSRQATEIDQVATAMNQMMATVQEVAGHAHVASTSAMNASDASNNGQKIVEETVTSINSLASEVVQASSVVQQLEKDTENINSMLDVISGISEQTNLLALNAAIEAARAGEQGRGFAVVADEVRTLAGRTEESTKDIQKMIESLQSSAASAVSAMHEGQNKAQVSVNSAARAGESLRDINEAISNINDMNAQIATASEEQASVAEEINRNISAISELGEQSSRGAQKTASGSQDMSQLAMQAQGEVGQFKI